jgi:non-ribosomal peptide synthetase component E (peptide arylation enzyme)
MGKRKLTYSYCQMHGIKQTKGGTFGQMLEETDTRHADDPAIIYQDQKYTYREFQTAVNSFVPALIIPQTTGELLNRE